MSRLQLSGLQVKPAPARIVRPLSRVPNPPRRRLRSSRLSQAPRPILSPPPQRQPTKAFLLADLGMRHEKLLRKYEAAVQRADVSAAKREKLADEIRSVERGIAALS